jgi:hypothetical protein
MSSPVLAKAGIGNQVIHPSTHTYIYSFTRYVSEFTLNAVEGLHEIREQSVVTFEF